jgi:hypothetical protein
VAAGGLDKLSTLSPEELEQVLRHASVQSFRAVALIPLLLLPIFGFIAWRDSVARIANNPGKIKSDREMSL